MSTEALNLDQAVEKFMAPEEPVQDESAELNDAADEITEEDTDEVDSDVEQSDYDDDDYESDSDDDDYDTDDESAEADDEPDQSEPETITVKVDGEEVAVTLEDLKRSYSGQGKIQKGMQKAAETLKQAQAAQQQASQIAQGLTALYQQVQERGFIAPPQKPSRELFDSDPIGYMEANMDYEQKVSEYQQQQQQLQQVRQLEEMQSRQAQQEQLEREVQYLREKIPELADANKAAAIREDLMRTANDYGYAPEDVAGITDHRALMVLRDAMRWRKSQAKRSQVESKAKNARPVIKPQAKKTSDPKSKQLKQSKSKLKKTGRVEDALSLITNI